MTQDKTGTGCVTNELWGDAMGLQDGTVLKNHVMGGQGDGVGFARARLEAR
jgi:hypothetical protein